MAEPLFDLGAQSQHDYAFDRLAVVIGNLAANRGQRCELDHQAGPRSGQLDIDAVILEAGLGSRDRIGPGGEMGELECAGGVGIDLIAGWAE